MLKLSSAVRKLIIRVLLQITHFLWQEETKKAKAEMGGLCQERCEEDRIGGSLEEEDTRQRRVEKNSR